MTPAHNISIRLDELIKTGERIPLQQSSMVGEWVKQPDWQAWITSALNLASYAFGEASTYHKELSNLNAKFNLGSGTAALARSGPEVLKAAKADLAAGVIGSLEARLSGEIFADFITLAKNALKEGQKDVAAVLACAALEDTLKKFAVLNELNVDGKTMDSVVGALKGAGLVSGAQKTLLDSMPKIRNFAMHADWAKISEPDVASVIAFTEQFLLTNMS